MRDLQKEKTPIPLPPEKVREVKPLPRRGFFKNLSPETMVRREDAERQRMRLPRSIWWGVAGLLALFVIGFIVSFFVVKRSVSSKISSQAGIFRAGIADLENSDPAAAAKEFSLLTENTDSIAPIAQWLGFLFQGGEGTLKAFMDTTKQFETLSEQLGALEGDAFQLLSGQGNDFVSHLKMMRAALAAINADSDALSAEAPMFGNSLASGNTYLSLEARSEGTQKFLDAFIPWFSSPTPHHVLVMLQNPSEIRPAGGFLGSYADITIASSTITGISVHDIADVDTAFTQMIVPPKPLQLEVSRWRPADANWFFDFPTSASETMAFFNESGLYAPTTTATTTVSSPYFDAVIAVSPDVVSDLLKVAGPVTVSSTKTTFTSDNFLTQVQKIVQAGQASSATYPKQVLRDLMSGLSAEIAAATSTEQQNIISAASNWMANRDVMAYAQNADMEDFIESSGAGGDVYALPQNFNGDYLALADANVNGGKSDLSVTENVAWTSQIGADGTMTDSLIVNRKHNGDQSPYWWYKTTNQVYFQAFVPPGTTLTNENGGLQEKIVPKVNYASGGYVTDPLVVSIESSTQSLFGYPAVAEHEEDGKNVFATWSRVSAGSSTTLAFDYTHHAFEMPAAGVTYQFVFEKQAGTNRNYSLEVDAPLGYQFAETSLPSWTYQSDDLPGRMIVTLTLEKI